MNSALEVDVNEDDCITFADDVPPDDLNAEDDLFTFPFDHIYACSSGSIAKPVPRTQKIAEALRPPKHTFVANPEIVFDFKSEYYKILVLFKSLEKENKNLKRIVISHLDWIQLNTKLSNRKDKHIADQNREIAELSAKLAKLERRSSYTKTSAKNLLNLPPVPIDKLLSVQASVQRAIGLTAPGGVNFYTPLPPTSSTVTNEQIEKPKASIISANYPNLQAYEESEFIPPANIPVSSSTSIVSTSSSVPGSSQLISPPPEEPNSLTDEMKLTSKNSALNKSPSPLTGTQKNGRVTSANSYSKSRFLNKPKDPSQVAAEGTIKTTTITTSTSTKKPKMIHTYRSTSPTNVQSAQVNRPKYCPSSGRFQLIENTTPVGEDPYQLGEADMRENSPIPKLTLQKSHGKLKVSTSVNDKKETIKDSVIGTGDAIRNIKSSDKSSKDKSDKEKRSKDQNNIVSGLFGTDWDDYDPKKENNNVETSCRDFSYGDNANNLAANILPHIRSKNFKKLNKEEGEEFVYRDGEAKAVTKKRKDRSLSKENSSNPSKLEPDPKKVRKGSLNNSPKCGTILDDKPIITPGKRMAKPLTAKRPYYTQVGNKDLHWHMPIDADFDAEDLDPGCSLGDEQTLEVPRWREKPYSSQVKLEGTENLEDSVFYKRHFKHENDEKRRKKWDIQRYREQRRVERLKRRQCDSWYSAASSHGTTSAPTDEDTVCSFWPHPHRDAQFIEICDEIPVSAFGEIIPALPKSEFKLPWIRSSKPKKRKQLTLL